MPGGARPDELSFNKHSCFPARELDHIISTHVCRGSKITSFLKIKSKVM